MCRIAGIIDSNRQSDEIKADVVAMCDAMAHGGPDDKGYHSINNHIVFGHRRLAIIDLSVAGHQPMLINELSITYNGEIYNYKELKKQLENLSFSFTTETDTEVIIIGFKAWGTELFNKLEGMFAFALHNAQTNETYLVRDKMGIKPLYYTISYGNLIFASEVKAFKESTYLFEEDLNWQIYFLAFGHIPQPFTTLKNIKSLTGGCFLKWSPKEKICQETNFKIDNTHKSINDANTACETLKQKLTTAIEKHLISDAPIGVFLSGGIDSSIITLLAAAKAKENLNTVSVNFAEADFSEEKYQKIITDQLVGKHTAHQINEKDFHVNFEQIMNAMDQPTNDGVNTWFVNKFAKDIGLKAVLSGIGADEILGGYPSFKRMNLIKSLKKLPKFILKLCEILPSDKLKRIYYLSYTNPIGEYLFLRGFFTPSIISKILNTPKKEIDFLLSNFSLDATINNLSGQERAAWFETNLFMKNQLLKDTDFMSMSHGVEVRVPFLDQNLLSAVAKISNEQRFLKTPKGLLINAFKKILPEAIYNRPKMGFSFPLQEWFLNHKKFVDEGNYENLYTKKLIRKFKKGNLHWSKAFAIYQLKNSAR